MTTKVERYDWANPGDHGRRCNLPVAELNIDNSYQRNEVSDINTLSTAREFCWLAFGVVVVMERSNGKKYIVDGQQRWLAAKRRGDIPAIPCVVFHSNGAEHEARAFIALNLHRTKVTAVQKFRVSDRAGIQPERKISEWLKSVDLAVTPDGKSTASVCFPAHLIRTWKANETACQTAIKLQRAINNGEPLHSSVHNGLCWLLCRNIDIAGNLPKLRERGGRSALLGSIRAVEIESGKNNHDRCCGLGILRVINHRRRTKIQIPGED